MIRTDAIIFGRFFVRNERLAALAIPTFIGILIEQPRLFELQPNILHGGFMFYVCRADKIGRIDIQRVNHRLKIAIHTIDVGLRSYSLLGSFCGYFISMLIDPCLKTNYPAKLTLIPCPHIRE